MKKMSKVLSWLLIFAFVFSLFSNAMVMQAHAEDTPYSLTVTADTGGTITSTDLEATYTEGEQITVSAQANDNYAFIGWEAVGGGTFADEFANPALFTMPAGPVTLTAKFAAVSQPFNVPYAWEFDKDTGSIAISSTARGSFVYNAGGYGAGELISTSGGVQLNLFDNYGVSFDKKIPGKEANYIHVKMSNTFTSTTPQAQVYTTFYHYTADTTCGGVRDSLQIGTSLDDYHTYVFDMTTVANADPGEPHILTKWYDENTKQAELYLRSHNSYKGKFNIDYIRIQTENADAYRVKATAGEGGTVTEPVKYARASDSIAISATPKPGYVFAGWQTAGGGGFLNDSASNTVFTMPAADVALTAVFEFEEVGYPLTVTADTGGAITSTNLAAYPEGAQVTISAQADDNHAFIGWEAVGGGTFADEFANPALFTMPAGPVTLTAKFAEVSSPLNVIYAWEFDEDIAEFYTPTPARLQLTYDGNGYLAGNQLTAEGAYIEMYDGPVPFATNTAGAKANYIHMNMSNSFTSGANPVEFTSGFGYDTSEGDEIVVNTDIMRGTGYTNYIFDMTDEIDWFNNTVNYLFLYPRIDAESALTGPFSIDYIRVMTESTEAYRIKTAGEGGTVSAPKYARGSDSIAISATPEPGYVFAGWQTTGGGSFLNDSASNTVFTMPAADVEITAVFEVLYPLTVTAGAGGTITSTHLAEYAVGEQVTISAQADANYAFIGWEAVGGGTFADEFANPALFTMPAGPVTLTAKFAAVSQPLNVIYAWEFDEDLDGFTASKPDRLSLVNDGDGHLAGNQIKAEGTYLDIYNGVIPFATNTAGAKANYIHMNMSNAFTSATNPATFTSTFGYNVSEVNGDFIATASVTRNTGYTNYVFDMTGQTRWFNNTVNCLFLYPRIDAQSSLVGAFSIDYVRVMTENVTAYRVKTVGEGGTVSAPKYARGTDSIAISATPEPGYLFTGWEVAGGGSFLNDSASNTVFTMPAADVEITANFEVDPQSDQNYITGFTIDGVAGVIEGNNITVTLPLGTDVSALEPVITCSAGATVDPASGIAQSFASPVDYEVTALNGAKKTYTVTVILATAKVVLNALIAQAKGLTESTYTPVSWQSMRAALQAAEAVADDGDATQSEVADATMALQAAIGALIEKYTDVSNMTDQVFFGVWSGSAWSTVGKLNYSIAGMGPVETAVKANNYTLAKEALLTYYQARDTRTVPPSIDFDPDAMPPSAIELMGVLAAENFFFSGESPIAISQFSTAPAVVSTDVTDGINDNLKITNQLSFLLMTRKQSADIVTISSKESGANGPKLIIDTGSGPQTLTPVKDATIQSKTGGANFGSASTLLLHSKTNPVADVSRAYITFDLTGFESGDIQSAQLDLYGSSADNECEVVVLLSGFNAYLENGVTWNNTPHTVVSWQGVDGGINWNSIDPVDGQTLAWLHRFFFAEDVTKQYRKTGDEYYAGNLIRIFLDFIKDKGNSTVESPISTGIRSFNMINAYHYLKDSESMNAEANTALLKYFWKMGDWLTLPANYSAGDNHGQYASRGLYYISEYLPELADTTKSSGGWFNLVKTRLSTQMESLVLSDGSYAEASSFYAVGFASVARTIKYMALLNNDPMGEVFDQKLQSLMQYLIDLSKPDATITAIGDSDPISIAALIKCMADDYDRDDFLYAATSGAQGEKPDHTSALYPDKKMAFMKTGYEVNDMFMSIILKEGSTHAHPDLNSVTAYAYGRELLVDPGRYAYDDGTVDNWMRNRTVAHNTIEINGGNQSKSASGIVKTINDWSTNDIFDFYEGTHAGYANFNHLRDVLFLRDGFWIVSDYITAPAGSHTYNQTWHMLPSANLALATDGSKSAKTAFISGANLQVIPADPANVTATLANGYYSPVPGNYSDAKYVSYKKTQTGDATFDAVLYPTDGAVTGREVTVDRLAITPAVATTTATALKINLNAGNMGYYYLSHEAAPNTERTFGGYSFNGKVAYVETEGLNYAQAVFKNGSLLKNGAANVIASPIAINDIGVKWNGNTLEISGTTLVSCTNSAVAIAIYAPDTTSVTLNGITSAAFEKDANGYVYAAADVSIAPKTLTVVAGEGGQITSQTEWNEIAGAEIAISASVDNGYTFVGWTYATDSTEDISNPFANTNSISTTFTMPNGNATVTANFSKAGDPVYSLALNAEAGGAITSTHLEKYPAGSEVAVSAVPKLPGRHFVGWKSDSGTFANPDKQLTVFTMPNQAAALTAKFAIFPEAVNNWAQWPIDGITDNIVVIEYDFAPLEDGSDLIVGFADTGTNGPISDFEHMPMIIRTSQGYFQAYRGTGYDSDVNVPLTANVVYHFRIEANMQAKTYSVYVTPEGGSEVKIASNYAFRAAAPVPSVFDTVCVLDNGKKSGLAYMVHNLVVKSLLANTKDITSFTITGGTTEIVGTNITVTVPNATVVTALVPTIVHTGASIAPASGIAQDFTSPVTYTVTAADNSTQVYTVTVTVAPSDAKAITAFSINGADGVINGTNIAVTLPYGTIVTALTPIITTTGASIAPASGIAQNFTSPVTYTVTAADNSTQVYTVTVTVAPSDAKAITAFSLNGEDGVINGTNIAITLPYGTNVTALVPTIVHTGASISPQPSVAQNFTSPVNYTVTAADNSTQVYTVTVTVAGETAQEIADAITSVAAPKKDATSITLPTVPAGYTITMTFDPEDVIMADGTVVPPDAETEVTISFTITNDIDPADIGTGTITVTVPAKSTPLEKLNALIVTAQGKASDASYTQASLNALNEAIESARQLASADPQADDADIEAEIAALQQAIGALVKATTTPPKSSTSSGGGGTVYGPAAPVYTGPVFTPLDEAIRQDSIKKALAAGDTALTVRQKNVGLATLESLKKLVSAANGKDVKLVADSMWQNAVDVRVSVNPAKATKDVTLSGSVRDQKAKNTKARFQKYFGNKLAIVRLDQKDDFGMVVKVAAKVDLKDFDMKNLYFYSYNEKTNTYKRIFNPNYYMDKNGYLQFNTQYGNTVVISEGPLVRK